MLAVAAHKALIKYASDQSQPWRGNEGPLRWRPQTQAAQPATVAQRASAVMRSHFQHCSCAPRSAPKWFRVAIRGSCVGLFLTLLNPSFLFKCCFLHDYVFWRFLLVCQLQPLGWNDPVAVMSECGSGQQEKEEG